MKIRHPADDPDDRVHIGGRRQVHAVKDGVIDVDDSVPESALEQWADGYGYELNELLVSDESDVCGTEMSDGSTCERPADDCPYHD